MWQISRLTDNRAQPKSGGCLQQKDKRVGLQHLAQKELYTSRRLCPDWLTRMTLSLSPTIMPLSLVVKKTCFQTNKQMPQFTL